MYYNLADSTMLRFVVVLQYTWPKWLYITLLFPFYSLNISRKATQLPQRKIVRPTQATVIRSRESKVVKFDDVWRPWIAFNQSCLRLLHIESRKDHKIAKMFMWLHLFWTRSTISSNKKHFTVDSCFEKNDYGPPEYYLARKELGHMILYCH